MSLPDNVASSTPVVSAPLVPDFTARLDLLVDYELGGVALSDPSQGLEVRQWRVAVVGADVCVSPHPEGSPRTALFPAEDVTELALAFDQLMHPTIAFVQAGVTKLYWYDSLAAAQVTTSFPGAYSPMLCHDDKRAAQVVAGVTDVLFFYLLGGNLCYRQQRDRFTVERVLGPLGAGATRITGVGMGTNGRVQVFLDSAQSLHVDYRDDKLYLLGVGGEVLPMHGGAAAMATWSSKVFVLDDQPSFGWARVDAAAYPVTLVVSTDGAAKTQSVTSDEPVRLPAVRGREWKVEVRATARVLSVRLAGSREELEADDASHL